MKLQLCLILILGLTFATQTERLNSVLAQIQYHPYGKALSALVQLQLQQEQTGRLDAIHDALDHFLTTLDQQDDDADAAYELIKASCETNIPKKEKEIQDLNAKLANLTDEKNTLEEEQRQKISDKNDEENNKREAENSLADAQNQLDSENTTFKQRSADFNEAIIACQEALRILRGMVHDPSVLQLAQVHSDFQDLQKTFEKHHKQLGGQHSAYIQPIIDVLMQLAAESKTNNHLNLERLKEVINLIQMLLDRLKGQFALAESNHKTNVENINKLITDYNGAIRTAAKNIETLLGRLQDIAERLGQINLENIRGLIATSQTVLDALKQSCDDEKLAYEDGKKQRSEQRALLEELMKYFKEKVVGAVENINDNAYNDQLTSQQ